MFYTCIRIFRILNTKCNVFINSSVVEIVKLKRTFYDFVRDVTKIFNNNKQR